MASMSELSPGARRTHDIALGKAKEELAKQGRYLSVDEENLVQIGILAGMAVTMDRLLND